MTITIFRGGRSRGIERHYPRDPGPWIRERGEVYRQTNERSKGRVVYEVAQCDYQPNDESKQVIHQPSTSDNCS